LERASWKKVFLSLILGGHNFGDNQSSLNGVPIGPRGSGTPQFTPPDGHAVIDGVNSAQSFNGKPQATACQNHRRLRLAVKRSIPTYLDAIPFVLNLLEHRIIKHEPKSRAFGLIDARLTVKRF